MSKLQRKMVSILKLFLKLLKGEIHKHETLEFKGNPDRALVIDRGIAHIFDNLSEMTTLNQARIYSDWGNPDFDPNIDVLNVLRDTPVENFPMVKINRFRAPKSLCRLALKAQRVQLRAGIGNHHPFRFKSGDKKITLIPKEGVISNRITGKICFLCPYEKRY
ncbi:hypothetical protein KFZ56_05865 [Virgibacillus sp. NKC19-3]|uniref:hypothetical protein n=1 Tax=Virgibacillus saliphilus TaxID=2831674 RepID=UPI001C9A9F0A|nr:hypothetical protein [Virgibacillus sp. NKC19-3]MBY7142612.1 hypothetical protein [Virgibacillus sp. NKC19-3]